MFIRFLSEMKNFVMNERRRSEKYKAYFIRLLLVEAVIFTCIIIAMSSLVSYYIKQNEKSKLMQNGSRTLAAISSYYDKKQDNFIDILMPMYTDSKYTTITSRFFEKSEENQFENDHLWRVQFVEMMKWICVQDKDIVALLFHKNSTNSNYVYDVSKNSFEAAPSNFPFIDQINSKFSGRLVVGAVDYGSANNKVKMYGIGSKIGTSAKKYDAGTILVLYDGKGLINEYNKDNSSDKDQLFIFTESGNVIFSSDQQNYGKKYAYFDRFNNDDSTVKMNGIKYFKMVMDKNKQDFLSVLLVPSAKVDEVMLSNNVKIFSVTAGFILLSAIFYFVAGYLVSKRVNVLIKATRKLGSHNLNYRIPIKGYGDEYEYISKRFNSMCDELQDTINKSYLYEIKQKNAELRELQACINPHFLYNTLEAIRVRVVGDENPEVDQMILILASFFRSIIKGNTIITIREEIYSCQMYLNLFRLRYQESLTIDFNVDDGVMEYSIIRNLIQPIIENYFIHGFQNESTLNRITIEGHQVGEDIHLIIQDNGGGMPPERLQYVQKMLSSEMSSDRTSYGVFNVNERIKLVYGSQYGISIESEQNVGTSVTVRLGKKQCEDLASWQRKKTKSPDFDI